MSMPEDELVEALQTALGGGPSSPEGLDYARRVLSMDAPTLDVSSMEGLREQETEVMGALRKAQERLQQMKGPTRAEKLLAIGAGLGAPTRTGAIGETAAAVSRNLAPLAAEQRAFEGEQAAGMSQLDLAMAKAKGPVSQAEMDIAKLQYEQEWKERIQAMKTVARGSGRGMKNREASIQDLITGWNYSRPDAAALVDGFVDVEIVPQTGRARLINKIDKSVIEVPIGSLEGYFNNAPDDYEPPPEGTTVPGEKDLRTKEEQEADLYASNMFKEGRSMWDMALIGTGPWSAGLAGISFVSSLFGGEVATETLIARQGLVMRTKDLVGTLIANDSGRMSMPLIIMTLEEVSTSPEIIDTGPHMQARMIELDGFLYRQYLNAREDADNPNLGEKLRIKQQANARAFGTFLRDLNVPADRQRRDNIVPSDYKDSKNFGGLPKIPESPPRGMNITQSTWDSMGPEQKARAQVIYEQLQEGEYDGSQ
jgi:hypothetical protein